ncbi:radial spoke head protein 3 homolog B isoform X1 [Palaemon carinicauda]|uniref:radial spoke head protein 3 homolog B isoform X1 n=1 Tax=Palaemon carinicauda TaxID=392227 RepID=UPI0035B68136
MQLRRQEFRQKLEARARLRRENHGISSLYPSGSQGYRNHGRHNVHVQTENYYEPLERPPETESGVQTDTWTEEGGFVVPVVEATEPGVDMMTQVYETELDAETDDDALLAALVGQTIREAVLEVAHEEQAEQARINSLAADSISSFLKMIQNGDIGNFQNGEMPEANSAEENTEKGEEEEEEPAASEEREEPEGKEQTPDEEEAPRTEEVTSPDLKEGVNDVTEGEDTQPAEVEA